MKPNWHYLVEIAGCCNLSCPSCPNGNSHGANRTKGLMGLELFKKTIDKISREPVTVEYISLYNWGEPLLNPQVAAMIEYVNSFRYRCTISSNLNHQAGLEGVIRANPFQFRISLSGFSAPVYSRTHTPGNIEKVKEGLLLVRRLLDATHSPTIVEVCYHKYIDNTEEELQSIKALCDNLGFRFVPTWAYFMPLEKSLYCCDERRDREHFPDKAFSLSREDQRLIDLLAIHPRELKAIHLPFKDSECTLRSSQTAINFDGSVSLCCGVWDDAYKIAEDFCGISHDALQQRKYASPFCALCRDNAQHMVAVNYNVKQIDEIAQANVMKHIHRKKPMKTDAPAISIIITAYNYGRFIGKAIESILSQDFTDFELLILNNASTDDTDEVVQRFLADPRIRYIVNDSNIGGLENAKKGLRSARAPFFMHVSADDFLLPGALKMLYQTITADASIDFVYGKYLFVDKNDAVIQEVKHPGWFPFDHKGRQNEMADLLQFDCYISLLTVLLKRSVFERFGDFSDCVRVTDYELLVRLAAGGCTSYFINQPLAAFRVHGDQMSMGGNVVSSGSQVNDQLTLLEMYLVPEHFPKLAGFEPGIVNLLASKLEAFNRCPDRNVQSAPEMQRRIGEIIARIDRLKTIAPQGFPMVSVIVPTKDRPQMLKQALQSILCQTYPNFEIIVINDGGEDITEMIGPLNTRNNIRCIRHETSRERSAARNSGLKAAQGKYIAYLDDDDRFYPDHLRILVNFLESHKVKAAYTDAYRALEELENNAYVVKQRQLLYSCAFDPDRLLVENLFPTLCVMHARECLEETGLFDETMQTHEDWDMWIRLSRQYCFHHIPVVTAEYSYRNDKTNTSTARLAEFNETRERIYRRYRQFAQLNAAIIEAQQKALKLHGAAVCATLSIFDFMNEVTRYVETNQFAKAISYYDEHRKGFSATDELEKFDSLVSIIKNREPTPVRS